MLLLLSFVLSLFLAPRRATAIKEHLLLRHHSDHHPLVEDDRRLQFVCDDADGPDSDDCLYNQCTSCLETIWTENCVGNHYPAECCNSLARHAVCLSDRVLLCGTSTTDGFVAHGLFQTIQDWCVDDGCPINWEGCDNDLFCSCFVDYKLSSYDCKYNDDTCRCPSERKLIECIQPEVDRCGRSNTKVMEWHSQIIQRRDDICARATPETPSTPVPPAFCSDADGPDSSDCLNNECIPCFQPLTYNMCSGDHYPRECCDVFSRYIWCLTDRSLTCDTGRTDGTLAAGLAKTFDGFCGDGCPINWEGCDNDVFCSCFSTYKSGAAVCTYNDDTCLCPLETDFVECTQPEVDRCGSGNAELMQVHAQRIQRRDDICARGATPETSPAVTTTTPVPFAPSTTSKQPDTPAPNSTTTLPVLASTPAAATTTTTAAIAGTVNPTTTTTASLDSSSTGTPTATSSMVSSGLEATTSAAASSCQAARHSVILSTLVAARHVVLVAGNG